jgi:hypothetical protein
VDKKISGQIAFQLAFTFEMFAGFIGHKRLPTLDDFQMVGWDWRCYGNLLLQVTGQEQGRVLQGFKFILCNRHVFPFAICEMIFPYIK